MRPVRAPLSTLLGLLLARWLLACAHRLLVRLAPVLPEETPGEMPGEVNNPFDSVDDERATPIRWRSRSTARLRRHWQRHRARLHAIHARYVKWRETDTAELVEQLKKQYGSLRDGQSPDRTVAAPQTVSDASRRHEVNDVEDWTEKVRRMGAQFVAPPSQSVDPELVKTPPETEASDELESTDVPALETSPPQKTETPGTGATLENLEPARVRSTSNLPGRRPKVIPMVHDPDVNRVARPHPAKPMPATNSATAAQPNVDSIRWPKTSKQKGSDEAPRRSAPAQQLPRVPRQASVSEDHWPSLPDHNERRPSEPKMHDAVRHARDDAATLWPSLPESVVPVVPTLETAGRRLSRLEEEQRGTLWNG